MKLATLALALFLSTQTFADVLIKNSNVTEVTIYRNYARETRIAQAQLPAGNSEVVISNITTGIDENSIQVGCRNGVRILSVSTRINYIKTGDELRKTRMMSWQDSVKLLNRRARYLLRQKEAYDQELSVLNANNKLGSSQESMKPELLKELLALNRSKQLELRKIIFEIEEEYAVLQAGVVLLQQQLAESGAEANGKPVREIVLKVSAPGSMQTQFRLNYLVTAARWIPSYEIRCENTTKPLMLSARARIIQETGYEWKNVKVKLSTANPNLNHNRPVLYPIYVDFMQPDYYKEKMSYEQSNFKNLMNDKIPYADNKVQLMAGAPSAMGTTEEFKDGMKLDGNSVIIAQGEVMIEYDLALEQDIESDGKEHIVAINEMSIPATYNYHTVPRMDNGVFLLARISDWGKYNLLPGDATIFFDEMYVGKSYINPNSNTDTLLVSLGRDEKLSVKRTRLNDLCITKKFSNKKKETRAFETMIRNNKHIPVEIEMLDQYPISRHTDIEVTLDEAAGAQVTKEYGKLLWKITLKPGESRKIQTVYTVKFPEDKMIAEKH